MVGLDVNHDGFISPDDVDLIVAHLAGDNQLGPTQPESEQSNSYQYDVNQDGIVSPFARAHRSQSRSLL